jgi:hypothetical protein
VDFFRVSIIQFESLTFVLDCRAFSGLLSGLKAQDLVSSEQNSVARQKTLFKPQVTSNKVLKIEASSPKIPQIEQLSRPSALPITIINTLNPVPSRLDPNLAP